MLSNSMRKAIADGRVEQTEQGLYVPSERTLIQGYVSYGKRGEEAEHTHNMIVGEGLNYLVGVATGAVAAETNWYVAVFSGDVTVQPTWTAANFATAATEFTSYDEPDRPEWIPSAVSSGARDSFAAKSSFTSSQDGAVIRGAALISSASKSSTTGKLMGATRFPSAKTLDTGEILDVGYGLQLTAV